MKPTSGSELCAIQIIEKTSYLLRRQNLTFLCLFLYNLFKIVLNCQQIVYNDLQIVISLICVTVFTPMKFCVLLLIRRSFSLNFPDIISKMEYCPPNVTLSVIWFNHGISQCFMDTVSTSIFTGFLLIFGSIQLYMYNKYASLISDLNQISKSKLFYLQIFLSVVVPILAIARFILQSAIYNGGKVYGYMVSWASFT